MGLDPSNLPTGFRRAIVREPAIRSALIHGGDVEATPKGMVHHPHPAPGDEIAFWIEGHPEPGGSKSSFVPCDKDKNPYRGPGGRIIVNTTDANPRSKDWKKIVARTARQKFTRAPFNCALEVKFEFVVKRPQGHYGTGRNAECVKDSAPHFPTSKPDCTKLIRPLEDACTSICWVDDAQIVSQYATKRFGPVEGCQITIRPVTIINPGNVKPSQPELPMTPTPPAPAPQPEDDLPLPL